MSARRILLVIILAMLACAPIIRYVYIPEAATTRSQVPEFEHHRIESRDENLKAIMKAACKGTVPLVNNGSHYSLIDPAYKIIYCPITKAASSAWKTLLARLAGDTKVYKYYVPVSDGKYMLRLGFRFADVARDPRGTTPKWQRFKYFTFVRHPLSRLLSAYKEKFTRFQKTNDHSASFFYWKYGREIIRRYRPNATAEALQKGSDVTFPEFVQFILAGSRSPARYDIHWRPQHLLCDICHQEFDFIGKVEHIESDSRYVMQNFMNLPNTSFPILNAMGSSDIRQFYANIPSQQLWDLIKIYRKDFEIFNYEMSVP